MSESLTSMNQRIHDAIADCLLDHLEAVTQLDFAGATVLWERFVRVITAHADVEDELAFPVYEALGEFPPGARPVLFEAEHHHIRRMIGWLTSDLEGLAAKPDRRAMILGLDRYVMFRHLLEHHTLRECNAFYPRLERELAPDAQEALRRRIEAAHDVAVGLTRGNQ